MRPEEILRRYDVWEPKTDRTIFNKILASVHMEERKNYPGTYEKIVLVWRCHWHKRIL